MKSQTEFRIGPGMASLLMILVTLLMAALAILAWAGAQTDRAFSERSREAVQSYYEAAAQLQQTLFEADQLLAAARSDTEGDLQAYAQRIREIQDRYPVDEALGDLSEADGDGGEGTGDEFTLRLLVPIRDERYIEAILAITPAFAGPRYALISHKVIDTMPWDGTQELDLFTVDTSTVDGGL